MVNQDNVTANTAVDYRGELVGLDAPAQVANLAALVAQQLQTDRSQFIDLVIQELEIIRDEF